MFQKMSVPIILSEVSYCGTDIFWSIIVTEVSYCGTDIFWNIILTEVSYCGTGIFWNNILTEELTSVKIMFQKMSVPQ
jgi:hypothetical protein